MGTNWFAAMVRSGRCAVTVALVLFAAAAYAQAPPVFVTPQSSIVSCISDAMIACASSFQSAHRPATAIGCVM